MKNSQLGTIWITDGVNNKKIKKEDSIPNGWKRGRVNVISSASINKMKQQDYSLAAKKRKKTMMERYGTLNVYEINTKLHTILKEKYEADLKEKVNFPFEEKSRSLQRLQILQEQNEKCLWCNLGKWLDKPITLELDHIDGNKKNNSRENLRLLCPNCHSQTNTWRKKKATSRMGKDD